jgi:tRNA U34 5-methylaminomethyl-2-thiouridine-forming methyltransferase MnmC
MQQLVQREVALQAREAQFAAKDGEVAGLRQELTSLRAAVPTKDLLEKFDLSPSDALKAMGKDPETVVRLMIAEQLHAKGQPVPEGLQKFIEKAASERRIAALETQLKQRDQAAQEAQTFSAVQAGGREYVKKIDGKKMPSLAEIAKTDPELAHSELMEEIERQVSKNPNSQLTYDSAAAQAETRLARLVKAIKGSGNSTQPTTPASGQKPTPPQTKAPAKPLRPWESKRSDLDASINDAINEFHRAEAAQKAARR